MPPAFGAEPDCANIPFVGYTIQQPIDAPARLADAHCGIWSRAIQRAIRAK